MMLSDTVRFSSSAFVSSVIGVLALCGTLIAETPIHGPSEATVGRPFRIESMAPQGNYLRAAIPESEFLLLKQGASHRRLMLPLADGTSLPLVMTRFEVTTPQTRFISMGPSGPTELQPPDVVLYRGHVEGAPGSHAFLSVSASGLTNGSVHFEGRDIFLSSRGAGRAANGRRLFTIHEGPGEFALPEFPEFCGVGPAPHAVSASTVTPRGSVTDVRGPRIANVAVDGDQSFVNLFDNVMDAEAYVVALYAAGSDIYERDLNIRFNLTFVRLWPAGGEPFSATDLFGFYEYWVKNENTFGLNYVHMLSGRRDTGYGGVGYVGGTCEGFAYAISAFLLGGFPSPIAGSHLGNWDVIVTTHEMGHNSGTYHTHDGYSPTIDDCGNGVPSRGTIMSYCHTFPGGTTNTDVRFHRRVQDVIESEMVAGNCFYYDCNGNGISDFDDISNKSSLDSNFNSVPDECEDCNNNGMIDEDEIFGGAPDVNGNFILDACEPDCNSNGLPDPYECDLFPANDADGNNVPDDCDPDCNNNGILDWSDVNGGGFVDVDRNVTPDVCQDCNANGISDWIELGRGNNLFVADLGDYVREYFSTSGYPVGNMGAGAVLDPYDCVFGPDRQLYVASHGDDRVVRINVDTGVAATFVAAGSGGLDGPSSLTFGPDGNLYVASRLTNSVIRYDGSTGALIGTFVAAGSGGLSSPYGLTFGPNGNLFVTSGNNTVIQYNGGTGALIGTFVSAGSGGLNSPRGLTFKPDGRLLVSNFNGNNVIEYNGGTGAFIRVFAQQIFPIGAWGIRVGPAGTVFVVRTDPANIRVYEYNATSGVFIRSYVRGDGPLPTPTGLDFRPGYENDCNANLVLDPCDPEWTDIELFVATLLADPPDPGLACMYDRNHDTVLDALDVQPFTDDLLP